MFISSLSVLRLTLRDRCHCPSSKRSVPWGFFIFVLFDVTSWAPKKYFLAMQAFSCMFAEGRVNFHFADKETEDLSSK